MKIELKTSYHNEYSPDKVTFEDDGSYIEINHNGNCFSVKKSDLRKVLMVLCEE